MHMEYRRLTGEVVGRIGWSGLTATREEYREHAKTALFGFYEKDERSFWPKAEHAPNAAEEVVIIDSNGEQIAGYTIKDMIADTGLRLIGGPSAHRP